MSEGKRDSFGLPDPKSEGRARSRVLSLPPLLETGVTRTEAVERNLCRWEGGGITAVTLDRASCCGKRHYRMGFCRAHFGRLFERVRAGPGGRGAA